MKYRFIPALLLVMVELLEITEKFPVLKFTIAVWVMVMSGVSRTMAENVAVETLALAFAVTEYTPGATSVALLQVELGLEHVVPPDRVTFGEVTKTSTVLPEPLKTPASFLGTQKI